MRSLRPFILTLCTALLAVQNVLVVVPHTHHHDASIGGAPHEGHHHAAGTHCHPAGADPVDQHGPPKHSADPPTPHPESHDDCVVCQYLAQAAVEPDSAPGVALRASDFAPLPLIGQSFCRLTTRLHCRAPPVAA